MTLFTIVSNPPLFRFASTLLACGLVVSTSTWGEDNASHTLCLNQTTGEERKVQLVYESPESPIPCTLYYEKGGTRSEIASAQRSKGYCEKKERNLVRNLVAGGWQCQHDFVGKLGEQLDRSLTLDLFAENTRMNPLADQSATVRSEQSRQAEDTPEAVTQESSAVQDLDEAAGSESAEQIANRLKATLEQSYIPDIKSRLEQDFPQAMGPQYVVDVAVNLSLSVEISPARMPGSMMKVKAVFPQDHQKPRKPLTAVLC